MKRIFILCIIVGGFSLTGCGTLISPWTVNKLSNSRYIPVEMWTGAAWSGEEQLAMKPVRTIFGSRSHKSITGPKAWTHPISGETLQVYERVNKTTKGIKRQLFTISKDGRGLAKVYDERPNAPTRIFSTQAVIFPVGRWQRGEKKIFQFKEYVGGKTIGRKATIHIRRLSFTYKDVSFAVKYDYLMHDEKGRLVFHERFIYGPGKSLMYYKNRL